MEKRIPHTPGRASAHTPEAPHHGSLPSYFMGFILSLVFTIIPYLLITEDILNGTALYISLFGFALLQLLVQLVFFLHIGSELRPRWKLIALLFSIVVVMIVVIGSIWIMYNLDYNMMPPEKTDEIMLEQKDKGF